MSKEIHAITPTVERPNPEAVAKRAYELFLQRGSVPGHEVDDWLQAEAELATAGAGAKAADGRAQPQAGAGGPGTAGNDRDLTDGARRPTRERAGSRRIFRQPQSH
jgi:hypothetical protein